MKSDIFLSIVLMFLLDDGVPVRMRLLGLDPRPEAAAGRRRPPARRRRRARREERRGRKDRRGGQGRSRRWPRRRRRAEPAKAQEPGKAGRRGHDATPRSPKSSWWTSRSWCIGSETDTSPGGYRLEARLTQKGAGVETPLLVPHRCRVQGRVAVKRPLAVDREGPDLARLASP